MRDSETITYIYGHVYHVHYDCVLYPPMKINCIYSRPVRERCPHDSARTWTETPDIDPSINLLNITSELDQRSMRYTNDILRQLGGAGRTGFSAGAEDIGIGLVPCNFGGGLPNKISPQNTFLGPFQKILGQKKI
jgi:hypothetical protein